MKTRFNTYDIVCGVAELQNLVGQRVYQIYDVDNKTYLIRFQGGAGKSTLLIESGTRFHTTAFEWPKNVAPSGFSMKLRKHLKNKRLESLRQLGADRIVDLQFGMNEASYHVILELYDRGNVILTDHELTILYILRPHTEGEELRFAVREKYPESRAKQRQDLPSKDELENRLRTANNGDSLYYFIMTLVDCGPAVIEHVLTKYNLNNCVLGSEQVSETATESETNRKKFRKHKKGPNARIFNIDTGMEDLYKAIKEADDMVIEAAKNISRGFIIRKKEEKVTLDGKEAKEHFYQNVEYHPFLFKQFEGQPVAEFETFMLAVDEFYSNLEGQRIDMKTLQQEREVLKKLMNVKMDHAKRLENLNKTQDVDKRKAELITCNQSLVDNALLAIRSALANQMSWPAIQELVKSAQANGDQVATVIKQLKLESNQIVLLLSDPYEQYENSDESDNDDEDSVDKMVKSSALAIDLDLSLTAWANARKYFDLKRTAAQKEQKTIDASQKALKSAERKTQQTLKDVRTVSAISKARKVYWFEKFYWFVSSENYLVIGGRDAQQNELIVKRYMRPNDIYVHAEIQGASSVVIRNHGTGDIPPKTLVEAGTMAISYSIAWDAKVITNAYWVHSNQVSKTAPSGEYLGTGSFMIRGKKNFLPSCHLTMGLSLLFKLEESCVDRHRGERKVRNFEDETETFHARELHDIDEEIEEKEVKMDSGSDAEDNEQHANENFEKPIEQQEEESSSVHFPDTEIKVEHDTGRVRVMGRTLSTNSETTAKELTVEKKKEIIVKVETVAAEEAVIIAAAPSRKKVQQNSKKRKEEKSKSKKKQYQEQQLRQLANAEENNLSNLKRGQKGKMKKIRAKYKDQDEEERQLRMNILKSAGGKDDLEALEVNDESEEQKKIPFNKEQQDLSKQQKLQQQQQQTLQPQTSAADNDDNDEIPLGADVELLEALTGQPLEEDELLFAIPVVAPYQALQNYKFKLKLTPGTGKRGRAAKTALMMFSKEKTCGTREKDLLKSIKDETLARNIPGKVKLSLPQLQKFKN